MADVGTIGEDQFALWCEQAGLTANPSKKDRYGWDFVVQFPHLDPAAPLDTRPAQHKCMVQVKSTAVGARRAAIKLDNWERMINDSLPWFVCALAVDNATVSDVYLVHIGHAYVERVLKQLRTLRATEATAAKQLHEHKLDVTWDEEDKVAPAGGHMIRATMLRHMGNDPFQYGQRKQSWYENAGYNGHPRTITVSISGKSRDDLWGKISNFSLGLTDKLPFNLRTIVDQRFGIPITTVDLTQSDDEAKLGHLKDPPPSTDEVVTIAVSNAQQTSITTFRCRAYHAATFHSKIPQKYRKLRFVSPAFELLMDAPPSKKPRRFPFSFGAEFHFPPLSNPDVAVPLADLAKVARVLRHMIEAPQRGLRIELRYAEHTWTLPDQNGAIERPEEYAAIATSLEQLVAIVFAFGLDIDMVITHQSVLEQQDRIQLLWKAMNAPRSFFPVRVGRLSRQDANGQKAAVIVAVSILLGRFRVQVSFAICGIAEQEPSAEGSHAWLELPDGEVRVLSKEVVQAAAWSLEKLAVQLQETASSLQNDGFVVATAPTKAALAYLVGMTETDGQR